MAGLLTQQGGHVSRFASSLIEQAGGQTTAAKSAAGTTTRIARLSRDIKGIAVRSRLLTLNARIECARLGQLGRSLEAVAGEMATMSAEIMRANTEIEELAETLAAALPAIAKQSEAMLSQASDFQTEFRRGQESTAETLNEMLGTVRRTAESSRERVARVVKLSQEALSSLQFQDPMVQSLGEVNTLLLRVQDSAGPAARASAPEAHLVTPMGAVDIAVDDAPPVSARGDVMLF